MAQLATVFVHHAEVHEKVWREHVGLDVGPGDVQRGGFTHQLEYGVDQSTVAEALGSVQHFGKLAGGVGQRHQARTRSLVQGLEQGLHFFLQHAGHQPLAALVIDLVQHEQRHGHGQAIARITGFVQVGGRAVHAAQSDGLGEGCCGDASGLVAHQLLAGEAQQGALTPVGRGHVLLRVPRPLRGLLLYLRKTHPRPTSFTVLRLLGFFAVPALKAVAAAHVGGQLLVVVGVDQFVVHQHVLAARLVLQLFDLAHHLLVGCKERQWRFPLAVYQCPADKDFARAGHVDPAVVGAPPVVDDDSIQCGTLQRHHLGGLLLPMRVQQLLFEQMPTDLLQPLRLDAGNAPTKQARGLHQLGRHNPAPGLLGQVRTGVGIELDAPRAQVFTTRAGLAVAVALALDLAADVAQQARQHGQVQLLVAGRCRVQAPFVLGHHGVQLAVDVLPLAHAADVDEVLAQQLLILAVRQFMRGRWRRKLGWPGVLRR